MEPTSNPILNLCILCGGMAFGSFAISAMGALLENTALLMFWYLGLSALFLLPPLLVIGGLSQLWVRGDSRRRGQTGHGSVSTL